MKIKFLKAGNPKGQSLVEFALSLTFMLILLAGAVDFGIGLFEYIAMRDAAQEGALYGSMNPSDAAEIQNRVANASGPGFIRERFDAGTLQVTVFTVPINSPCEGNGITVTVQYDHPLSMPFIGTFIGSDHIRLRATVTDTILTPPTCP
jgi:Flp pilus assembly protein TadG